ncbi:MAG: hypothetical protein KF729_37005 [Sandaracinaceae bacterium]|nr:hypothetical protein [Sandaracinaceae bacterium]
MRARIFVAAALALAPGSARAQPPEMQVPWADVAPARAGDVIQTAALGVPDERIGSFVARRAAARDAARRRAMEALHAYADAALAAVRAHPREASAVHEAIGRAARVAGVRPLSDGGAVVVVEVPVGALRTACGRAGLPWVG